METVIFLTGMMLGVSLMGWIVTIRSKDRGFTKQRTPHFKPPEPPTEIYLSNKTFIHLETGLKGEFIKRVKGKFGETIVIKLENGKEYFAPEKEFFDATELPKDFVINGNVTLKSAK